MKWKYKKIVWSNTRILSFPSPLWSPKCMANVNAKPWHMECISGLSVKAQMFVNYGCWIIYSNALFLNRISYHRHRITPPSNYFLPCQFPFNNHDLQNNHDNATLKSISNTTQFVSKEFKWLVSNWCWNAWNTSYFLIFYFHYLK